jgi:hypothetical protein
MKNIMESSTKCKGALGGVDQTIMEDIEEMNMKFQTFKHSHPFLQMMRREKMCHFLKLLLIHQRKV